MNVHFNTASSAALFSLAYFVYIYTVFDFFLYYIDNIIRTHTRSMSFYRIEMKLGGKPFLVLHRCNREFFHGSIFIQRDFLAGFKKMHALYRVCLKIDNEITWSNNGIIYYAAMVFRASFELNVTRHQNSCWHNFFSVLVSVSHLLGCFFFFKMFNGYTILL